MKHLIFTLLLLPSLVLARPRLFVLTDLANEPDDEESLVRLLVYANEFDIEGLVATTSIHLRKGPREDILRATLDAYAQVRDNLAKHAEGYPTADALRAVSATGQTGYGIGAIEKSTAGSKLLAAAMLRPDARPLWISIWGGANTLLRALRDVKETEGEEKLRAALPNLKVYSICDQDDAGYVIRAEFPTLEYIVDPCPPGRPGFGPSYDHSTWRGISGDLHGRERLHYPHRTMVENAWLQEHIRAKGPLGKCYPPHKYFMEGDTPAYLGLIDNGLGWAESPAYGGWGGRYQLRKFPAEPRPVWATPEVCDLYDGKRLNFSSIIRWREDYQNDFSARMDWSVTPDYKQANHNPVAVLNGSKTTEVVRLTAKRGDSVALSAIGTSDPDGDGLGYEWFVYDEASTVKGAKLTAKRASATLDLRDIAEDAKGEIHVILKVRDNGEPNLFAYRRAIVTVE